MTRRAMLAVGTALQAGALLALAWPASAQPAPNARPLGGTVAAGAATISQTPDATTITQTSQRAALNWQSFNVGSRQRVTFDQPSSNSVTLNRVTGPDPSQIAGRIDANGQVVLVNQSGVTFFRGAQVNAAGLVVSAAGISDRNFMAGKLAFDQAAKPDAVVSNAGSITIGQAGLAALVAPQVRNSGVITAKLGHVVLAGAKTATVDLYGDGLLALDVSNQVTQAQGTTALVTNSGTIRADGGTVQLTARAADGLVQTLVQAGGRIGAATTNGKTGTIVVSGIGGSVVVDGQLAARGDGAGGSGGAIAVSASDTVKLGAASVLDASGRAGGGVIAVGTTLARAQGGPAVAAAQTARRVLVQRGAKITADATQSGNGGRIAILSRGATRMNGAVSAKGVAQGGSVEISGKTLGMAGALDVSARGTAGTILLDPEYLEIVASGTGSENANLVANSGTVLAGDWLTGTPDTISASVLDSFVGNVLLQAERTITVAASVSVPLGGITLEAGSSGTAGTITVNAGVTLSALGDVVLETTSGGETDPLISVLGAVGSNTGSVILLAGGGGTISLGAAGSLTAASGERVTLQADSLVVASGTGSISALNGLVQIAPATLLSPVVVGGAASTDDLSIGQDVLRAIKAETLEIGEVTLPTAPVTVAPAGVIALASTPTTELTAGAVTVAGAVVATTLEIYAGGALQIGIAGDASAGISASAVSLSAAGPISEPNGTVTAASLSAITTGSGDIVLGNAANQIAASTGITAADGQVVLVDDPTLVLNGTYSGSNLFFEVTLPGGSLALGELAVGGGATLTVPSGGRVSLVADVLLATSTSSVTAPAGTLEIASFSSLPLAVAAPGSSLLSIISGGTNALQTLRLGDYTDVTAGGTALVVSASAITLEGPVDLAGTATRIELVANGTISQPGGALTVADLFATTRGTGGDILLDHSGNAIGQIFGMVATDGSIVVVDAASLTLAGTQSGSTLFYEVAQTGGALTLQAAAALTAGGRATLVADTITAGAGATIASSTLELSPFTAIAAGVFGTGGWQAGATLLGGVTTGTLVVGGFTDVAASVETARASSVAIEGAADLTGIASSLVLLASGAITEPGGPLTVGTLSGAGSGVVLANPSNTIGTLGRFTASAGNVVLEDGAALAITGAVAASGNVFLSTPGTVSLAASGGVAAGSAALVGVQAATLSIASGGTISGGVFEFAPASTGAALLLGPDGALTSLAGISAPTIRFGAVTLPGGTSPSVIAGSVATTGTFEAAGATLELYAGGPITDAAGPLINVATLGGTGDTWTLTAPGTSIAQIANLTATGFTLADATALGVIGTLAADTISLTADAITVPGAIQATGSLALATSGTIAVTGTLLADTLSGSAASAAIFGGSIDITTLGNFTAAAFNLTDASTLTVAGTLTAPAIILRAPALNLAGEVNGTGTVALVATGGSIDESGSLTAGTLTGSATGPANLTGSNSFATLGNLTSSNLTLFDSVDLAVQGSVNGDASITIRTDGALTVVGSAIAARVGLSGTILAVPGTIDAGGAGFIALESRSGGISATGIMIGDTLYAIAADAVSLSGANRISILGDIKAASVTLVDAAELSVNGTITGGSAVSITDADALSVAGSVTATAVSLTANTIAVPGKISASAVSLTATAGTIAETGALFASELSGSASGGASLTGANTIGALGSFAAADLTLDDSADLTINGAVTAPSITIRAPSRQITLAAGATLATAGSLIPDPVPPADLPSNGGPGTYLQAASFVQSGGSALVGLGGGAATVQLSVTGGVQFDTSVGLQASGARLILDLGAGTASGRIVVGALDVSYTTPGSAALTGTIRGLTGAPAASLGVIQPGGNGNYLFNGCTIGAITCALPPPMPPPPLAANPPPSQIALPELAQAPLRETLRIVIPQLLVMPPDSDDLLQMPVVSEQDY